MTSTKAMFLAMKAGAAVPILAVSLGLSMSLGAFAQDVQTKQYEDGGVYEGA
jgi:predicted polyphosphate/ATP-dependent NAD kinase